MSSPGLPARIPVLFRDEDDDIAAEIEVAMTSARSAQGRWSQVSLKRRLSLIRELRRLIAENASQLAEASARVRQRPIGESLTTEIVPLAEACRFLEREAGKILTPRRLGSRHRPVWLSGVTTEILREPIGVVLIIGPGNYPLLLPGVQLIQALAAGNAVLLKPGVDGTPAARVLCETLIRAGFDPDLVRLLPESPEAARAAIRLRPDKVLFTGSAATGQNILAQLAPHLVPATMELSGCDAVIIRADADLQLAVKALVFGLTLNGGATCMSPKRVFVSAARATELEGSLARAIDGNEGLLFCVRSHRHTSAHTVLDKLPFALAEAVAAGAHLIAGKVFENGKISLPLILGGVSPKARLLCEDIFAPIIAVVTVEDDEEAIFRANNCPFALTTSIFSRDGFAARQMAGKINAGVVTINDLIVPTADARVPFGGRGQSGFGATRGAEGLLELTRTKVVSVSRNKFHPAFDSPQPGDEDLFNAYLKFSHGRGLKSRGTAFVSILRKLARRQKSTQR